MAAQLNPERKPQYPLTATFEDGERWVLDNAEELGCSLEWIDTDEEHDPIVRDALGRHVRLKVEALQVLRCELSE